MPTYDTQAAVNAAWGEPLTVTPAGGRSHTVTGTRHLNGEEEGRTSYGVYTILRETYTLATDAIPGYRPKLRDQITPDGEDCPRVVTRVDGSPWLKFWKLTTAYPALACCLDQTATVLRVTSPTPTDEGFRNPNLTAVYSSQAVRLQPDTRTREWDTAGRVTTRERYICVFGSAVTLNAGDVVEISGTRYEVTEQGEIESLGVLTFAACERIS